MKKLIIFWNCGFGENAEIVEAADEEAANALAYEAWRDEAESNADYRAESYTKELALEHDLEDEDEGQAAE